jgi:mRNA-degrading endonuclease RelE of RelBE toxin-antitoxin system
MVRVCYEPRFEKLIMRIKDSLLRIKLKKQIQKVINNPKSGKPMSYGRRGTRELYIKPFRLSYLYLENKNTVVFADLYHKKKQ